VAAGSIGGAGPMRPLFNVVLLSDVSAVDSQGRGVYRPQKERIIGAPQTRTTLCYKSRIHVGLNFSFTHFQLSELAAIQIAGKN
jgi:hypothetical protein